MELRILFFVMRVKPGNHLSFHITVHRLSLKILVPGKANHTVVRSEGPRQTFFLALIQESQALFIVERLDSQHFAVNCDPIASVVDHIFEPEVFHILLCHAVAAAGSYCREMTVCFKKTKSLFGRVRHIIAIPVLPMHKKCVIDIKEKVFSFHNTSNLSFHNCRSNHELYYFNINSDEVKTVFRIFPPLHASVCIQSVTS